MSVGPDASMGASPIGDAGGSGLIGGATGLDIVEAIAANRDGYQTLLRYLQDDLDLNAVVLGQPGAVTGLSAAMQAGDLIFSGAASRSGALLCDGSAVSRTTYSTLFSALGGASSPFGPGDGSTTFNVPDYRGRVPIGTGTGSGLTARARADSGGEEAHYLSTGEMPSHSHADLGHQHGYYNPTQVIGTQVAAGSNYAGGNPVTGTGYANLQNTGGGGSHNNMPPYAAINVFIKT